MFSRWLLPKPPKPRAYVAGQPILISGRFRSGSTLLWQLLRATRSTVAFYEPDHDGLLAHIPHTTPMPSHVGVTQYWDEYAARTELLAQHHRRAFGAADFLLEANDPQPQLKAYLEALINSAALARAVLKLNRFSLRLGWLRAQLPQAHILHISREPRAAWVSSRRHLPQDRWALSTELDAYDLLQWTLDLAPCLPFLAPLLLQPSYALHFALWRLSDVLAERLADTALLLERDLLDSHGLGLERLVQSGIVAADEHARLRALIVVPPQPSLPHPPAWFEAIEADVEATLSALGLIAEFGLLPLAKIRQRHARAWARFEPLDVKGLIAPLLAALSDARAEQTRLLGLVRATSTP